MNENPTGIVYATDRDEDDYCERGTQGCAVNHTATRGAHPGDESHCETW